WKVMSDGRGGHFVGLGDVNGDDLNDFARVTVHRGQTLAGTAFWNAGFTGVSADALYHNVAQVFLSVLSSDDTTVEWAASGLFNPLGTPTLQFEPDAPGYRTTPGVAPTQYLLAALNYD